MRNDKRACFALIAATIINKRRYINVYDFSESRHISISASSIQSNYLSFFDFNRGGYVSGNKQGMYDFPSSSNVSININGNRVDCYDFETNSHISFTVNGSSINVYDFEFNRFYNYSVN